MTANTAATAGDADSVAVIMFIIVVMWRIIIVTVVVVIIIISVAAAAAVVASIDVMRLGVGWTLVVPPRHPGT